MTRKDKTTKSIEDEIKEQMLEAARAKCASVPLRIRILISKNHSKKP
jgi:hypothetical protein